MTHISEDERRKRFHAVANAVGTHVLEDLSPDDETLLILRQYECGALSLQQFSEAMDAYAGKLVQSSSSVVVT